LGIVDFTLTAVASILFVVDPLGAVPAYLVMTQADDPRRRRQMAAKATLFATITLALFAAFGNGLFHLFGATMAAFRIAGGLILFLVALDMIRARRPTQEGPGEVSEGVGKEDVAFTPLGIPMLAGPAALSTVAMLTTQAKSPSQIAAVYLAILLTGLVTYLTLLLAEPLLRGLGRTGIHVFTRVLGLVLATIAVQFVLDGIKAAQFLPAR
jgi:multiple antibiotic resistance protein